MDEWHEHLKHRHDEEDILAGRIPKKTKDHPPFRGDGEDFETPDLRFVPADRPVLTGSRLLLSIAAVGVVVFGWLNPQRGIVESIIALALLAASMLLLWVTVTPPWE